MRKAKSAAKKSIAKSFNRIKDAFTRINEASRIPRSPSLMDRLQTEASQVAAAQSPELDNLVVLPIPGWGEPLYMADKVRAQIAEKFPKKWPDDPDPLEALTRQATSERAERARISGTTSASSAKLAGIPIKLVALASSDHFQLKYNDNYTEEMQALAAMDRSLGRVIATSRAKNSSAISAHELEKVEVFAEAFAALRHIQIFGKNTGYLDYRREATAAEIVLNGNPGRYTTDALKEAYLEADKTGDAFFKLSPRGVAVLAAKIADEFPFEQIAVQEKVARAYAPVAAYYQGYLAGKAPDDEREEGDTTEPTETIATGKHVTIDLESDRATKAYKTVCLKTFNVMTANRNDADIFKAGQRFLSHPDTQTFLAELARDSVFWKTALEFINTHDPARKPRGAPRGIKV